MSSEVNAGPGISRDHHCPTVANTSLVAPASATVNSSSLGTTKPPGPINTSTFKDVTSSEKETNYGGVSSCLAIFQKQRHSRESCKLIMDSWRLGTRKQYGSYLQRWINFCIEQEIDYLQLPLELALAFLTKKIHGQSLL